MTSLPDLSPLVGCVVGRLDLDYRVGFNLASQDPPRYGERVEALLVVEAPFLVIRGGNQYEVNPDAVTGYEQTLALLHSTVLKVDVKPDQALDIEFSGDQTLRVEAPSSYEAWELSGKGVPGWIAGPS
jgi:hypothetical protein